MLRFVNKTNSNALVTSIIKILLPSTVEQTFSIQERGGIDQSVLNLCIDISKQREQVKSKVELFEKKLQNTGSFLTLSQNLWLQSLLVEIGSRNSVDLGSLEQVHRRYYPSLQRLSYSSVIENSSMQHSMVFLTQVYLAQQCSQLDLIKKFKKPLVEFRHPSDISIGLLHARLRPDLTGFKLMSDHLIHIYDEQAKAIHDINIPPKNPQLALQKLFKIHLLQKQFPDHQIIIHFRDKYEDFDDIDLSQ